MKATRSLALLGGLAAFAAAPSAQEMTIAQAQGDAVFGTGGEIRSIRKIAVTDTGIVFTNCLLDNVPSSGDDVVLLNGFLSLPEGAQLAQPVGAEIDSFLDLDVNENGFLGWPLEFKGSGVTNPNDTGIYWNTVLLAREGSPVFATEHRGELLPIGTDYNKFNAAKISNRNSILFVGQLDLPTITGTESAVVLIKTDGLGNITEEEILYLEGYPYPGTTEEVVSVGTSVNSLAIANDDSVLVQLKIGPQNTRDSIISLNDVILAREGEETPLPLDPVSGNVRTYTDLGGAKIDVNDFGEYVFTAFANGDSNSNVFLNVNGSVYIQEGDNLPAFGNATVDRFDTVGMMIANSGDLYWYVKTSEGASTDQYMMRNDEIIVQENSSAVEGESITGLISLQYSFHVSDSGRFWISQAKDGQNDDLVLFADFGTSYPLFGCGSNPGTLLKENGEARAGETLNLTMDGEQAAGTIPFLFLSLGSARPGNLRDTQQCGIERNVGELMISLARSELAGRFIAPATDGGPVDWQLNIPNDPNLVGLQIYTQGVYWDINEVTTTPFQPTNGYYIEIGAP